MLGFLTYARRWDRADHSPLARGESKINLANRFLIKFAITDIFGDSI